MQGGLGGEIRQGRRQSETVHLRLGLEHRVFKLESLTWCLDFLRIRFLVAQHRRNSARNKVIGRK